MTETMEPPKKYTPNNVCYWETTSKDLITEDKGKPMLTKARKFLENDCIRGVGETLTTWECLPLPNYNKTTYRISLTKTGFVCNCQGFNKKLKDYDSLSSDVKPICSHILAVKQLNFINKHN